MKQIQFLAITLTAMLGGTAFAQPAPATSVIEVTLADFSFTPAALSFQRGQHYRLHLLNRGSGGHNFSGKAFFAAVTLDPDSEKLVSKGKVEVPKRGSVDLGFTPVTAGSYPIRCTHFLHSGFGMKGTAVIG